MTKKTYTVTIEEDDTWCAAVLQLLEKLSIDYEYTIDEYSMIGFIWKARVERLSKLINEGCTGPALTYFEHAVKHQVTMCAEENKVREEYRKALQALMPNVKFPQSKKETENEEINNNDDLELEFNLDELCDDSELTTDNNSEEPTNNQD